MPSSRTRRLTVAVVALVASLAVLPVVPAVAAAPAAARAVGEWTVEPVAGAGGVPAWRVTWRPGGRIPVRAARGVITSDGRPVGPAVESADLRSVSAVTTDLGLVAGSPTFALAYEGAATGPAPQSPPAGEAASPLPRPPTLDDDPGRPGPFAVRHAAYDLGDTVLPLPGLPEPVELAGVVFWPDEAAGPRPVVVFLHGRHATCYQGGEEALEWPCRDGMAPVPSHRGYDAAARVLASHGYVVLSLSANGVNANDAELLDGGAEARGRLVLAHLDRWRRWAADGTGPAGEDLVGRLDLDRIGLMGHSRGGEGVVRAALLNAGRARPYGIRAVLPLAPTDFGRLLLPEVAMAVVLPYCDGDVITLQGQHYYEDARHAVAGDRAARSVALVLGANHNWFNSQWAPGTAVAPTFDDWFFSHGSTNPSCDPAHDARLTAAEQLRVGTAYVAGFFRLHLGGEDDLLGLFDGTARAASAGLADVRVTSQSPDRVDLARFSSADAGFEASGLRAEVCAGAATEGDADPLPPCATSLFPSQVPHWAPAHALPLTPTSSALLVEWDARGGSVTIPVARARGDLSRLAALTFRAAVDPAAGPADLSVRVTDRAGRRATVAVSELSAALRPLPGTDPPLPRAVLQQVRIPLDRLAGVDLRAVASIAFLADRSATGRVWLADVAAQRSARGASRPTRAPHLTVADVEMIEGDDGAGTARFEVRSSAPAERPVRVFVQATLTLGEGYFEPYGDVAGWLVLPAGRTVATVDVPVRADQLDQPDLRFLVSLSLAQEAVVDRVFATGLVVDDDPTPTVTIEDATATEAGGALRFRVRLSAPSGRWVTVVGTPEAGTAQPGTDFGEDAMLFADIPPGEAGGELVVAVVDDDVAEPTESMLVRFTVEGAHYDGPGSVTGTILDDDPAP